MLPQVPINFFSNYIHLKRQLPFASFRTDTCTRSSKDSFVEYDQNTPDPDNVATIQSLTFFEIDPFPSESYPSPDLIADFLMELGSFSTSITGSESTNNQSHHKDDRFKQMNEDFPDLHEAKCDVTAFFTSSFDLPSIIDMVQNVIYTSDDETSFTLPYYKIDKLQNPKENVHKEFQKPVLCAGFLLKLPWHTDEDITNILRTNQHQDEPKVLTLEGGVAFGSMAEHPTTRLCLSFLQDYLSIEAEKKTKTEAFPKLFLDYGAGSGILGLAACKLGVHQAVGIEMDVDAIQIANANAQRNACNMHTYLPKIESITYDSINDSNKIEINDATPPAYDENKEDRESLSVSMVGAASRSKNMNVETLPDHLSGQVYDLCVANILPKALMTLGDVIGGMVKPGMDLALSGIRDHQAVAIIEVYSKYFDQCRVVKEEEGWVLIHGRRKENI